MITISESEDERILGCKMYGVRCIRIKCIEMVQHYFVDRSFGFIASEHTKHEWMNFSIFLLAVKRHDLSEVLFFCNSKSVKTISESMSWPIIKSPIIFPNIFRNIYFQRMLDKQKLFLFNSSWWPANVTFGHRMYANVGQPSKSERNSLLNWIDFGTHFVNGHHLATIRKENCYSFHLTVSRIRVECIHYLCAVCRTRWVAKLNKYSMKKHLTSMQSGKQTIFRTMTWE